MMQCAIRALPIALLLLFLSLPAAAQHFSGCLTQQDTGTSASVVVEDTVTTRLPDDAPLEAGDEIALVTDDGTCAGRADWQPDASAVEIAVAGPDASQTGAAPSGYASDEPLKVTVWDASEGTEYDIGSALSFADCAPGDPLCESDGRYETDAVFTVTQLGNQSTLPVELSAFSAVRNGEQVRLVWRTASETNNAGFAVQHQRVGPDQDAPGSWRRMGFVEGAGTTSQERRYDFTTSALRPGLHRFRLRQVDTDGTTTLSDPVSVRLPLQSSYTMSSVTPNPVRHQGRLIIQVRRTQEVRVTVFNMLGQRVRTLHDGPLAPNTRHALPIDASQLPSGAYVVRATGERFSATRRLTVVR